MEPLSCTTYYRFTSRVAQSSVTRAANIQQEVIMAIAKIIGRSILALTIAAAPVASGTFGITGAAYAKDGNGNSGGGGGNGNGGGRGGNENHGKSDDARSGKDEKGSRADDTPTLKSLFSFGKKSDKTVKAAKTPKADKTAKAKVNADKANTAGISSLNRNYHAYLNSNDPRMAAISAYAIAYAEFEAENGPDVVPTDPALSDEALRDALASFTKDGVVTDDTLEEAKDILGVGPAVGKIDEIRDTLPETTSETTTTTTTIEVDTAN